MDDLRLGRFSTSPLYIASLEIVMQALTVKVYI